MLRLLDCPSRRGGKRGNLTRKSCFQRNLASKSYNLKKLAPIGHTCHLAPVIWTFHKKPRFFSKFPKNFRHPKFHTRVPKVIKRAIPDRIWIYSNFEIRPHEKLDLKTLVLSSWKESKELKTLKERVKD